MVYARIADRTVADKYTKMPSGLVSGPAGRRHAVMVPRCRGGPAAYACPRCRPAGRRQNQPLTSRSVQLRYGHDSPAPPWRTGSEAPAEAGVGNSIAGS